MWAPKSQKFYLTKIENFPILLCMPKMHQFLRATDMFEMVGNKKVRVCLVGNEKVRLCPSDNENVNINLLVMKKKSSIHIEYKTCLHNNQSGDTYHSSILVVSNALRVTEAS